MALRLQTSPLDMMKMILEKPLLYELRRMASEISFRADFDFHPLSQIDEMIDSFKAENEEWGCLEYLWLGLERFATMSDGDLDELLFGDVYEIPCSPNGHARVLLNYVRTCVFGDRRRASAQELEDVVFASLPPHVCDWFQSARRRKPLCWLKAQQLHFEVRQPQIAKERKAKAKARMRKKRADRRAALEAKGLAG